MMMMMIMIMAEHHGAEDGDGDNWTNIFLRIGWWVYGSEESETTNGVSDLF
jgi:hypothetical protein